jgi:prevent-host-death family protein
MNVGTKQLKNNLSRYLRLVRAGERVVVTDRGVAVAELCSLAPSKRRDEDVLLELERAGIITRGGGRSRVVAPVVPRKRHRSLSAMVIEDRD